MAYLFSCNPENQLPDPDHRDELAQPITSSGR